LSAFLFALRPSFSYLKSKVILYLQGRDMSTKSGWMEKRKHERVVATLKIQYRMFEEGDAKKILKDASYKETTVDQLSSLSKNSPLYHAVTRDISLGGMSLIGEHAFPIGAVVEVGLQLPHYKTVLKFAAEVVRSDSFVEMQRTMHRAGLKILAINRGDLEHISRFLHIKKLHQELKDDLQNLKEKS
jgi:hypothetical protein